MSEEYQQAEDTDGAQNYLEYVSEGGGRVCLPEHVDPWLVLGVGGRPSGSPQEAFNIAKKRFLQLGAGEPSRQKRAKLSIAYEMIGEDLFSRDPPTRRKYPRAGARRLSFKRDDPFVLVAAGHTRAVVEYVARRPNFIREVDSKGNTLLYKAARSGFYDLCKALIRSKASPNAQQANGSSALHAASFFGHQPVAELLLEYGANSSLSNHFGNSPLDEAHSDSIKRCMEAARNDTVLALCESAIASGVASHVEDVMHGGKRIACKLVARDGTVPSGHEIVWHGTKAVAVESILQSGLQATGARLPDGTLLKPHENHYKLGKTYCGVENWAQAIFVSPSIAYAGHACYAERVFSRGQRFCVIIGASVRSGKYRAFPSTVLNAHEPLPGEPENPEYRVEVQDECSHQIWRVGDESSSAVRVNSCLFLSLGFLEDTEGMSFAEVQGLLGMSG